MPRVKVKYLNVHYDITRKKEEYVEFKDSLTLRKLLDRVSRSYAPKFRDSILDKENKLKPYVWVLLNREVTKDLETDLKDGDVIVFSLPLIGG